MRESTGHGTASAAESWRVCASLTRPNQLARIGQSSGNEAVTTTFHGKGGKPRLTLRTVANVTLEQAVPIFETSTPDQWSTAHTDLDSGTSTAIYHPEPALSIVSCFLRAVDKSTDIGQPWVVPGHPAAWPGSISVLAEGVEIANVPGFSVRGMTRVPEPASPDDRTVETWKIGLFRISTLLEYNPAVRAGFEKQFENALAELGITHRWYET